MQVYEHFEGGDALDVAEADLGRTENVFSNEVQPGIRPARTYAEARENSGGYDPRTELGISGRSRSLGRRILDLEADYKRSHDAPGSPTH